MLSIFLFYTESSLNTPVYSDGEIVPVPGPSSEANLYEEQVKSLKEGPEGEWTFDTTTIQSTTPPIPNNNVDTMDTDETVPKEQLKDALKNNNLTRFDIKPESSLNKMEDFFVPVPGPSTASDVPNTEDANPKSTPSIIATVRELTEVVEFSPNNLFYHIKGGGKDAGILRVTVNGSSMLIYNVIV